MIASITPRKKRWLDSITLGQLILGVSIAFLFVTIFVIVLISVQVKEKAIRDLAREDARQTSRLIFQSLYSAMRKGWNKREIGEIIVRLNQIEPDMKIHVFRGLPVIRQFGEFPGEAGIRQKDPELLFSLLTGQEKLLTRQDEIRYIYPIVVKQECLACHTQARLGDINGVIDVTYPIKNLKISMNYIMNIIIGYFAVMMLVLFVGLYLQLKKFIAEPVIHFVSVIQEIIQHTDLTQRVQHTSRITEFRKLTEYFNRLLSTLYSYQARLEELSVRDPLTGVYNRRKFEQFLETEIDRSQRHDRSFTLVMLDLDNFKHINDTYGHPVGDLALKELAMILNRFKRKSDILARLGGDEFALILPETPLEKGLVAAENIRKLLSETSLELPTGYTRIHASIGVVTYPENGEETEKLRIAMDVAMYKAKRMGKNQVSILEQSDHRVMMEVFRQGEFLRKALDEDRVLAFFQPLIRMSDGEIFAYEVLARIVDGDTIIPAADFIQVAEGLGYAEELDRRILEKGLIFKRDKCKRNVVLFFNFSSRSFQNMEKVRQFPDMVRSYDVSPAEVVIEITEREALPHIAELAPVIDELHSHGVRIALDDFGSGFSSFMYLKYLPVDFVKIEGSFIRHMSEDDRDRILVKNMHQMAAEFGLQTIAEYVEDAVILSILKDIGIHYAQGFYFGAPQWEPEDCMDNP